MDEATIRAIGSVTRSIFQGARIKPLDQFQDWAFNQIKLLIPFDSGEWLSGLLQSTNIGTHHVHFHRMPGQNGEKPIQRLHPYNPLLQKAAVNPELSSQCCDIFSSKTDKNSFFHLNFAQPFSIEHAITHIAKEPVTGLLSATALYRSDFNHPFTHKEKMVKQLLSPLLDEAHNINIFSHIFGTDGPDSYASAICDHHGILREAEPAFSKLMLMEWESWRGPKLNINPVDIFNGEMEARFHGNNIVIKLSLLCDLVLLRVRRKGSADMLSPAEVRVATCLTKGLTNKEIARQLNISPKTVSNHLHHIYSKLSVHNRQRAVVKLQGLL